MSPNSFREKIVNVIIYVMIFFLLVIAYCYLNGRNDHKIATRALITKDYKSATTHFSRAISWYLPYTSYVEDSIKGIIKIAKMYEANGQNEEAKYTYNILRGALFSVRSTYTPGEEYLKIINERLASLGAESIVASNEKYDYATEKAEQMRILDDKGKPDIMWSSVAAISFLAWVFLTIMLIRELFKNNVVNLNSGAIIIMVMLFVSYVVWIISLTKA